jgi:hypothetical protein
MIWGQDDEWEDASIYRWQVQLRGGQPEEVVDFDEILATGYTVWGFDEKVKL